MIEVERLVKKYADITAIDGISFRVEKGEILGFLGPNGAGKTTTMRILTCFMPASSGRATVAGYDCSESPMEVKKRIGYLPESAPLYSDMKVGEFLDFSATVKGLTGDSKKRKISRVMEDTGISDVSKRLIGKLSRGYRQRVGLAQALINDPEVLILDEPTAGLDPKQIVEIRELIKNLAGKRTIILSTHILPEVSIVCDRVVIINKGKVIAEDTPKNLTAQRENRHTYSLTVDGDQQDVTNLLLRIDGVKSVEPDGDIPAGHIKGTERSLIIETGTENDLRRDISAAVVNAGFGLLEMRQKAL
ncbi:MAG: ATP-binding cassette domain-containing protein, partial [Nitrospinota bacterium]